MHVATVCLQITDIRGVRCYSVGYITTVLYRWYVHAPIAKMYADYYLLHVATVRVGAGSYSKGVHRYRCDR